MLATQKPPGRGPRQFVLSRGMEKMPLGDTSTVRGHCPQAGTWWWPLILTLARHHALRVALGQQPRVAVEAGLLHFRRDAQRGEGKGLLPQPKTPGWEVGTGEGPGRPQHTCAAKSHHPDGHQVDGVGLPAGEELQPDIADADKEQGAQGEEVTCRRGDRGRWWGWGGAGSARGHGDPNSPTEMRVCRLSSSTSALLRMTATKATRM